MKKEPEWLGLLFEHTHRQGNIAGVQIIVSFFVLGFVWKEGTPLGARWVMFLVYLFCAIYLINSLYRIQDRRIALWRYITTIELGSVPDEKKKLPKLRLFPIYFIIEFYGYITDNQDEDDKETEEKKLRKNYIKKLRPAPKKSVLIAHIFASVLALIIILLSLGYK